MVDILLLLLALPSGGTAMPVIGVVAHTPRAWLTLNRSIILSVQLSAALRVSGDRVDDRQPYQVGPICLLAGVLPPWEQSCRSRRPA
jgi:hypothetical protein